MTLFVRSLWQPARRGFATIGQKIPDVSLYQGFPPKRVNLPEYCAGKKVLLVGLPGAFTPT